MKITMGRKLQSVHFIKKIFLKNFTTGKVKKAIEKSCLMMESFKKSQKSW